MAARLGAAPLSQDRSTQPVALPGSASRLPETAPGAMPRGRASAGCAELLLRAQLGDLTPAGREQLQHCR